MPDGCAIDASTAAGRSRLVVDVAPGVAAHAGAGNLSRPGHELFGQRAAGRGQGKGVALLGEGLAAVGSVAEDVRTILEEAGRPVQEDLLVGAVESGPAAE